MPTKNLHVLGIDPGGETGWCWLTVRRAAIFGPSRIHTYSNGTTAIHGQSLVSGQSTLQKRTRDINSTIRYGLNHCVSERWDIDPASKLTDRETSAQSGLTLACASTTRSEWAMPTPTSAGRARALTTYTDERLKRLGLYVPRPDHHPLRHPLSRAYGAEASPRAA